MPHPGGYFYLGKSVLQSKESSDLSSVLKDTDGGGLVPYRIDYGCPRSIHTIGMTEE
jgi:hypothetical protein